MFDADYGEVAEALGKSEAACRQLVHRAKQQLQDERPAPRGRRARPSCACCAAFADAATRGEFSALKSMLADDAQLIGDGGGKVPSFGVPLVGGQRIAQLYLATAPAVSATRCASRWWCSTANGGCCASSTARWSRRRSFETDGERIVRIHVQRNPDKLARIAATLGRDLNVTRERPGTS